MDRCNRLRETWETKPTIFSQQSFLFPTFRSVCPRHFESERTSTKPRKRVTLQWCGAATTVSWAPNPPSRPNHRFARWCPRPPHDHDDDSYCLFIIVISIIIVIISVIIIIPIIVIITIIIVIIILIILIITFVIITIIIVTTVIVIMTNIMITMIIIVIITILSLLSLLSWLSLLSLLYWLSLLSSLPLLSLSLIAIIITIVIIAIINIVVIIIITIHSSHYHHYVLSFSLSLLEVVLWLWWSLSLRGRFEIWRSKPMIPSCVLKFTRSIATAEVSTPELTTLNSPSHGKGQSFLIKCPDFLAKKSRFPDKHTHLKKKKLYIVCCLPRTSPPYFSTRLISFSSQMAGVKNPSWCSLRYQTWG